MKKIITLFLTVCLLISSFSLHAVDAQLYDRTKTYSGTCGDNLTWTLLDGVLTISGTGDMPNFFSSWSEWSEEKNAYVRVEAGAPPWNEFYNNIESVVIEEGVTRIGIMTFAGYDNITNVSIPGSVKEIGIQAFYAIDKLKEIIIPSGVETIGTGVFLDCNSLEKLVISDTVKDFSGSCYASSGTQNLKTIIVDENNPYYTSVDSIVYNKDMTELIACAPCNTDNIKIPDTVITIQTMAFSHNQLKSIEIPNGVMTISYSAFWQCSNLQKIVLPDTITTIQSTAFAYCPNLTYVELSSNVDFIGEAAFKDDTKLSSVYFRGDVPTTYKSYIDSKIVDGVREVYVRDDFSIFYGVSDDFVIYYNEGTEGWTTPTWTAPDGNVFNTVMIPNPEIEEEEIPSTGFISENFVAVNTYEDTTFSDVAETDWYQENVKDVYELGLMIGNDNSQFQPTKEMSLEEALTIACRMNSVYFGNEHQFTMTEEHSKWYDPYVDYATSEQNALDEALLDGLGKVGSRAQVIGLFSSLMPKEAFPAINDITMDMIPGLSADDPYAEDILMFYRAGIIVGVDEKGTFNPEKPITRAEIAAIATRIADHSRRQTLVLK